MFRKIGCQINCIWINGNSILFANTIFWISLITFLMTFIFCFTQHISVKDKVWAKKSNGRFYKARVISTRNVTLYCVYITEDSSFVQDLTSDDIVSRCDKLIVGDKMMVKLGTDDLYQGEFVAEKIQLFCTVKSIIHFNDNEQR